MDSERLLGDFLRARREAKAVEEVGIRRVGRRRTPGLRREEVAMLAGVSTDYYIRLEQGRERRPSEHVLEALARVLDLDSDATEHLFELARPRVRRRQAAAARHEEASPHLVRLLHSWQATPAFVHGRYMDILAANPMADALYAGLGHRDNLMRMTFLDPAAREFFFDWEQTAYNKAAMLRAAAGTDPDDPFLPKLVEELSAHSDEFRRLWARHDVRSTGQEWKHFHHREVGELQLAYESFSVNSAPGQQLVILQAEPGSLSEHALSLLAGLVARDIARSGASGDPRTAPEPEAALALPGGPAMGGHIGVPSATWRTRW
ncbi:helix-turn-helix transcriptional regulator [Sphaerisporangium rhizosphaerae]|uniref:Helix-turn-helix transcriptional regulator n=1 Tax=Sphaerisporangium rhizosphaerae TaxID=2269375 RepID=A0ABW2PGL7_9ACTN